VRDFTNRLLAARKAETSPATFRRYADKFLAFLGAHAAQPADRIDRNFPTVEDGVKGLAFVEAAIQSSALQKWQTVKLLPIP
jgi:hypothetical protein